MYDELQNNRPVKLFTDQFRTPISLNDASKLVVEIAAMDIKNGTINLGGSERVSRYEMGEMLCSLAGFDKHLLQKISMDDIPNFPKVEDVSLNIEKLQSLGVKPRTINENILELMANK
jgi:dTDP-4-dehydrorhamnose reductase